ENAERRALQQRFMDIIDFLPDPTFVIDEHKRVIAWSKACEAMTGVKKDQVIGQGDYAYAEALFGQRRPILIDLLDQFDSSVEASYTLLYRMEDRICGEFFLSDPGGGQKKYLWGVASPLYDQEGRRSGAIEAIRNITERRQAEEKIRLLNEDLRRHAETLELRVAERMAELTAVNEEQRAIFESAGAGILLITGRVIQRCNRKFEEITGYSQGELIGQSARILYQDEESFTGLTREVYNQLTRGEVCCKEQQIVRKDGSLFWARLRLCACDVHVPFGGMVGIFEDITAEREAKEQLCQALENAQEADRAKSVFLASISHELRTPLNSIIGFVGAILQELAGPLNPEQCKQLGMVRKSARHLLALINDVLDISKINAGELELDCRSFSLKGSIEKVVKLIAPLAEQKGIELRMVIDGEIEEIVGDQRRLEQVMLNLLNNAVKFTEKGRVSIACRRDDDGYSLAVTDTGIGMPADKMPNLFTPFYQIDSGLARKHEGTGLGLSICKKIVDMMGGTITVASEWGQGSIFTVRLPGRTQGVRSE
ncbi:MAG: ATP-binding protein, partial [Proteobacteria bacterium]|nr:ATP-binding protein [Pseudomonadota bacterium]